MGQSKSKASATESDDPVCHCANPLQVGAGDQGLWNSCAVFAFVSTLQTILKEFKLDIDVQSAAEAILMSGIKNRKGELVMDRGVDIPWLVEEVARMGFLLKATDGSFLKTRADVRDIQITWNFYRNVNPAHTLIAAGGKAGNHGNHALHVKKILKDPLRMECDNSWGSHDQHPVVPGPMWDRVLQHYEILLNWGVSVKASPTGEWVDRAIGGFTIGQTLVVKECIRPKEVPEDYDWRECLVGDNVVVVGIDIGLPIIRIASGKMMMIPMAHLDNFAPA